VPKSGGKKIVILSRQIDGCSGSLEVRGSEHDTNFYLGPLTGMLIMLDDSSSAWLWLAVSIVYSCMSQSIIHSLSVSPPQFCQNKLVHSAINTSSS
jgi:hypothetical protein